VLQGREDVEAVDGMGQDRTSHLLDGRRAWIHGSSKHHYMKKRIPPQFLPCSCLMRDVTS
jgi:hypothetical protein